MRHRLNISEGSHDCRFYVFNGSDFYGSWETEAEAIREVDLASAAVAIRYAGMDCRPEDAINETFGTDDPDERDRLSDLYYLTALNLLDGAERSILEELQERNDQIVECHDWQCLTCGYEWTGTDSECYSCANPILEDDPEDL